MGKFIHLYSLLFLLYSLPAAAQNPQDTVYIPDPIFKAYLLAKYDGNRDGHITYAEAANIGAVMNISGMGIKDATGIEAFTRTFGLICNDNEITRLDLSNLDGLETLECNNNKLTYLNARNSYFLRELYANNNQLSEVYLPESDRLLAVYLNNNQLTQLDLSKQPNLFLLLIKNNKFNQLDFSKSPSIQSVRADSNQLIYINFQNGNFARVSDISLLHNEFLHCIQVDDVAYANQKRHGFSMNEDVIFSTQCEPVVYIPDANFRNFLLNNPNINTNGDNLIHLSEAIAYDGGIDCFNRNISDLTGIEAFTNLYSLDCSGNNLSRIDLSKNKKLTTLIANRNYLSDLDLRQNNFLTHLEVANNNLRSLNLQNGNNANIHTFNTTNNYSLNCISVDNPAAAKNYTHWQKDNHMGLRLDCSPTVYIPDANFKNYLLSNTAINTNRDDAIQVWEAEAYNGIIDCSERNISNLTGIEAFINIKELICYGNNLTYLNLNLNSALTLVNCRDNQLTNIDVSENKNLEWLYCYNNRLTEINVSNSSKLKDLLCHNNNITGLDLSKNTLLEKFYCNDNKITGLNLSKNTSLKDLRLQHNLLTELNVKNGKNNLITALNAKANPNLMCIQVDNAAAVQSYAGWQKENAALYATECNTVPDSKGILYVKKGGAGNRKGNNWENAASELADALVAAKNTSYIKQIWVAKGTYKPMYSPRDGASFANENRDNAFSLVKDVKLYGGFDPENNVTTLEHNRIKPDASLNGTVLSGNIGSAANNTDNVYHVVVSTGDIGAALIDGFVITEGYMDEANSSHIVVNEKQVTRERGSGITLVSSSPKITNVVFTGNTGYAGVVANTESTSTINNMLAVGNKVSFGTVYNTNSSPVLTNVTIAYNTGATVSINGTAIRNVVNSSPVISSSIIWGNTNSTGQPDNIINSTGVNASTPRFNYSLVEGAIENNNWQTNFGIDNGGNINTNPLFTHVANNDYTLSSCSPAINAGNPLAITTSLPPIDLAGNTRIQFNRVDMGAFESIASEQGASPATNNVSVDHQQSSNAITYYADACNNILASITASGTTNALSGEVAVSVSLDNDLLPKYAGRKYEITPSVNPTEAEATITLYYTQEEFDEYNIQEENRLKLPAHAYDHYPIYNLIIRKQNDNETVDIKPNSVIWNATALRWEVSFDVRGFSTFYVLVASNNPLPLLLLSFTSKENNCKAELNWTTADEQNVSHFEIEQSADGVRYFAALSMTAKGRSENDYSVTLPILPSGVRGLYYRLKMVDIDGQFSYSPIATLTTNCTGQKVSVYPNPASTILFIENINLNESYSIHNTSGQLILKGKVSANRQPINVSHLPAGIYFLKLTDGQVIKFNKH